ncbi:ATP-binding protein [Aquicoccus sp. G2-2]|uniref:ATP-binding protein n=1 Tax=Aquicoccus sp. G2-2 TaxID=3092120 RepID=UPI002AE04167|nr:ATP-binding protein [Aquicoccus sp. G2-2]MEA1114003.1 ATP-binding protein [Aquicoccus sp. G2-2]
MDRQWIDTVLGGVPLPMVAIGADERIITANPTGEALLGADQIGRHHALALRQPALLDAIKAALHHGTSGQARYVILGPSHEVTYLVTVTAIPEPDGNGALCAFQDMTEQELIGQFRRDFVANVSHELRTPLTTLVGFIETLKGAAKDDPAARDRFLTIMEHEAGRMARLVRDLLSLSKVEAEERRRPTTPVNIAELLQSVAESMRPILDASGVELEISGTVAAPHIPADADQLRQVFQNLIENAVKYGAPGKIVRVAVQSDDNTPMLRIDVIDQGAGIEPQHLPRLAERFYRIDNHRSRKQGGTGLGLAIAKHIVNRHRGRLTISSEMGKGSCFSVFLPKS